MQPQTLGRKVSDEFTLPLCRSDQRSALATNSARSSGEGRLGERTIKITAMGENRTHNTVSTVSRVSDHGDRAGLNINHPPPGLEQAL